MNCPSRTDEDPKRPGRNQSPPFLPADLTTREDLNGIVNVRRHQNNDKKLVADSSGTLDRAMELLDTEPPYAVAPRIADAKLHLCYTDGESLEDCSILFPWTDSIVLPYRSLLCKSAVYYNTSKLYFPLSGFILPARSTPELDLAGYHTGPLSSHNSFYGKLCLALRWYSYRPATAQALVYL